MGRSSASYGGRAPEPLNRSGSPSPHLVRSAATTPSISLPTAISPETTNSSTLGACAIFYPREQSEKGFVGLGSEIVRTVDQRFKLIARLAEITLLAALN